MNLLELYKGLGRLKRSTQDNCRMSVHLDVFGLEISFSWVYNDNVLTIQKLFSPNELNSSILLAIKGFDDFIDYAIVAFHQEIGKRG